MKKKIFSILLCIITLLSVYGCSEKVEKEEESNNIIGSYEIKCDALDNVKYSTDHGFVTNDNDVYYVIYGKVKNGENCTKVNEVPIKTYYGNKFIDNDNNVYEYNERDFLSKRESYNLPSIIKDNDNIIKHKDYAELYTYYLTKDGVLYDGNNNVVKYFDNEKILDFGVGMISPTMGISFIKTDKAYYLTKVTNIDECEEYADIQCNYDLIKDDYFTKNYNNIAYIKEVNSSAATFVTKDSKVINMEISE